MEYKWEDPTTHLTYILRDGRLYISLHGAEHWMENEDLRGQPTFAAYDVIGVLKREVARLAEGETQGRIEGLGTQGPRG